MGTLSIQRERLEAVRHSQLDALLSRHWAEIAHFRDIPLDVDWPLYEAAEAAGKLRIFTARVEGNLVGYAAYIVNRAAHYRASLQALEDVIYLEPEYRRGRLGLRLITYADEQLALEGVQCVYHHEKLAHPALGQLLERIGYRPVDRVWAKRLDGGT